MTARWQIDGWAAQDRSARSAVWKRWLYRASRSAINLEARRHLSTAALARWQPELVLRSRGFPLEERRRWATRGIALGDATVLVQGTGTGWDALSWAELRPKRVIATDVFAFDESWEAIAKKCRDAWGVSVEFRQAPLEDHSFLSDHSIDLCVSDAVFEHCRDLPAVMRESARLLRARGNLYASFGPLWYAPGGDHFSVRGGLSAVYSHVELEPPAYRAFFEAQRQPVEDFQSGGRYVELDLFSKLKADDYLAAFRAAGFRVDALVAEIAPLALEFEHRFPERFASMLTRLNGRADIDDLRLKALICRLVPR